MKKITTILFDFDGTIMDTNDLIVDSWQHTFRTYRGKEEDVDKILDTFGEPLETTLKNLFPEVPVEESIDTYRNFQWGHFEDRVKLFDGMKELIIGLKEMGYKVGMTTSRLMRSTQNGLVKFGIMDCFDAIIAAEDVTKHKPDPEPLMKTLEKLGSTTDEAIMIGDSYFDILCAKNAGVPSVLVSWTIALRGKTLDDFTDADRPDYMMYKAEDFYDILKVEDDKRRD